ncbi:MAG: GNAT family N-acetyltransferase [Rudaea sp.]
MTLAIREIGAQEFALVWPIFSETVQAQETYAYDPGTTHAQARDLWTTPPARCFVADLDGAIVGAYMLRPNQAGPGSHVANAGYMTAPSARGRGVAGRMCEHSMDVARGAGFLAMQFNCVVSSNATAVRLWQKHGFGIVGTLPRVYRHASLGFIDAYVMHRFL